MMPNENAKALAAMIANLIDEADEEQFKSVSDKERIAYLDETADRLFLHLASIVGRDRALSMVMTAQTRKKPRR